MSDLPPCPNSLEGQYRCARSDVFVERETEDAFVFRCRTCGTVNVFPKSNDEQRSRYQARLQKEANKNKFEEQFRRKKEYSYGD